MSLPKSKPLPDNTEHLPPARWRKIRRHPGSAQPHERQALIKTICTKISLNDSFFLFSTLGTLITAIAIATNQPALLILALIVLPFNRPLFQLALTPAAQTVKTAGKSLLAITLYGVIAFIIGLIVGWLAKSIRFDMAALLGFTEINWANILLLTVGGVASSLSLLRKNRLPRLVGILLSYTIHLPYSIAGLALAQTNPNGSLQCLLIGFLHITLAVLISMTTFIILGLRPNNIKKWVIFLIPLILSIVIALFLYLNPTGSTAFTKPNPTSTPTQKITPSQSLSPTPIPPSETPHPTLTLTPTSSPMPTTTSTITSTPQPTTFWGIIVSEAGVVIRESPNFDADVITYAYDKDTIQILDSIQTDGDDSPTWYQIRLASGETGWIAGALVRTATPNP
jgi:hypothetical protein